MRMTALLLSIFALPLPALCAENITRPKNLHIRTVLAEGAQPRALIVSPTGQEYLSVARAVRDKIEELSKAELPLEDPAELDDGDLKQFDIILLGNAQDNPFVRKLVWERWILDTWHPGDEGFVVRSIHNPFGHGRNIIFVGGENPTTVRAAADKFLGMLKPGDKLSVGWIMTYETDRRGNPPTDAAIRRDVKRADGMLEFKNGRTLISGAARMARRYYSSGHDAWARLFKVYMDRHGAIGAPGMATHMGIYDTVAMWELIEEGPAFSDADRLSVTNHLLYLLRSKEGCMHRFFRKGTKQRGVRHNHQTLPGLACLFGGRYFSLGYGLPEAAEWMQAAKKLFDTQKISHKPQCDCNSYEWGTLYQTGWWSLGSGDYTFFENGSMRAAADRAILQMDNRGYSSCNGDFWSLYYFPLVLFRQAATFYRDGRYEWAIRKRYAGEPSPARRGVSNMVRGVEPVEPTDLLGIKVAPMGPHFYDARNTTMPNEPERNIPIQESFDKMSFRRTFDAEDQYLLIDGIGCGSHGHVDVNGVSQFTDNSRVWLMDCSYAEAPGMRDHNVVTVMRNGVTGKPPPLARLDGVADLDNFGFSRTSLQKYCSMDWRRNIFWAKEHYFVFIDELVALAPGDYTLRCHWRTPGAGRLDGMAFTVSHQAKAPPTLVRQITRQDGEGDGKCMKIVHADGALCKKVDLARGKWTLTVIGCGHHPSDDSFYFHVDGRREATVPVSPDKISPSKPIPFEITRDGEHEIRLTLRERPGTICDKVVLNGPDGRKIVIDALELDIAELPPGRIDTFTLHCMGAQKASLRLDEENVGKWFKKYPYTDAIASIVQFGTSRQMKPGDRHCFASVFFVGNANDPIRMESRAVADGIVLTRDGEQITCLGVGPATFRLGDSHVEAKADQFVLSPTSLAVRRGTSITWRGYLLSSEEPVTLERAIDGMWPVRSADLRKAWSAAAPPPRVAPAAHRVPELSEVWRADIGAPVLDLAQGDVDGDGKTCIAAGCEDNKVRLLDDAGRTRWEFEAGGKVNSVAIADIDGDGKCEIIAGSDDRCCYALDADGSKRWQYEGAAGHDPYWRRYWKAGQVEKVLAADINGDGKKEVVFGAANMHIHACDVAGELLWRFKQYGVCTSIVAADLTGDGKMEVVGGPAKITCYSNCNVINESGKLIGRFGNDGWASALTAICAADLDGDGDIEVVCGTNKNNIYALDAPRGKPARRWKYAAGDVVNSLCAARLSGGPGRHVIAGSASEFVYALRADGGVEWTTNLLDVVRQVAASDLNGDGRDEIIASTPRALSALDAAGEVVAASAFDSPISCFDLGRKLLVATRDGKVRCLRLGR